MTSRSRRNLVYHFVGIQPNEGVGREGMSGAIIGMHMHDKTSTTAHSKGRQQHSRTYKTGTSVFKRAGREYSASLATGAQKLFGLWRVRFPPVLVRTGRRLPVQALGERGVLVSLTGYPRRGPGTGLKLCHQGYQKSKRNLVYEIWSQ